MKAYKGFNKDFQCRGFQYKVGETYEIPKDEEIKLCQNGFHACLQPLDVIQFYSPTEGSRYAIVEIEEEKISSFSSKVVGRKITIIKEINFQELIEEDTENTNAVVEKTPCTTAISGKDTKNVVSTGEYSYAINSSDKDHGAAVTTSPFSYAIVTGNTFCKEAITIRDNSEAYAICDCGDGVSITEGEDSFSFATGSDALAIAKGHHSMSLTIDGYTSVEGNNSVAIAISKDWISRASGKLGDWLIFITIDDSNTKVISKTVQVDGKNILPDIPYTLTLSGELLPDKE
ncbi:MAG: hypothetical protein LUC37_06030 [Prevotella sp.]|nr:hypothetical protein [Prevotella sp.]